MQPMSMDRRSFLAALAGVAAAFPRLPALAAATGCPPGVQLYTVREPLERDFEGTLARIAEIGYREVEFAGYFGRAPGQVRRALAAAGLRAPGSHVGVEALSGGLEATVEAAAEVGHDFLVLPWIPEEMRTAEGFRRLADLLNRAGERSVRSGVRVGYHNQEYDFHPVDGRVPLELLWEHTEPGRVIYELDVYWAARAGADPIAYLERFGGSIPALHLKDMDATAQRGQADLGQGTLDIPRIMAAAAAAGVKHCFVEHDSPASPLDTIQAGYDYLRRMETAR
jgi:sugar phosphate isomerase/epimerase